MPHTFTDEDMTMIAIPASSGSGGEGGAEEVTHTLLLADDAAVQHRIPIGVEPLIIGRVPPCDLVLDASSVSRTHCRVELARDEVLVTDLGSTNGTYVDGKRIEGAIALQHGAALRIGSCTLTYERRTRREIEEAAAIERDLQGASAYVQMLLPKPLQSGPVLANWLFLPSTQLGGNAFGYRFLTPDLFAGYMIDVAGQGTGAAMHSVTVMNLLRQPVLPGIDLADPADVLAGLNARFRPEEQDDMFFSICYFVFDIASRQLRYAAAGRQPGFLLPASRERTEVLPDADAPAIGLELNHRFAINETVLAPGTTLYLLSDGAMEAFEAGSRHGSFDDLGQLIRAGGDPEMPEPLRLYHAVRGTARGESLTEDFSVIAFTFT